MKKVTWVKPVDVDGGLSWGPPLRNTRRPRREDSGARILCRNKTHYPCMDELLMIMLQVLTSYKVFFSEVKL